MQWFLRRQCNLTLLVVIGWMSCLGVSLVATSATAQTNSPVWLEADRPDPKGQPTKISVGIYVLNITHINDAQQTFTADVSISASWQDQRLAHGADEPRRAALQKVWHPRFAVFNARQIKRGLPEEVVVTGNGQVIYVQRYTGTFDVPLDLHRFPKDEQLLRIQLVIVGLNPDQVKLVIDDETTSRAPKFTIADWHIAKGLAHISAIEFSKDRKRPAITYEVAVQRDVQYYRLKVVSTLALIVLMSWIAFWMGIGEIGPKLAMGASSMITLIAYRFYLTGLVPRISYMTQMDFFVQGATVLVFSTLFAALMINYLHKNGRKEMAQKTQFWCRVTFPAALVALIAILEF